MARKNSTRSTTVAGIDTAQIGAIRIRVATRLGRKSLNPTFRSVVAAFGLWIVNVSMDVPFTLMVEGEKPVETVGGSMMVACAATSTARHTHSRITTAAAPP